MKPKFIHNPKHLTYEDALDDRHKDWVVPAICPECQEQKHECECPSEASRIASSLRSQCNLMTKEEREAALQEGLKITYRH
jgi:hypothetical protein